MLVDPSEPENEQRGRTDHRDSVSMMLNADNLARSTVAFCCVSQRASDACSQSPRIQRQGKVHLTAGMRDGGGEGGARIQKDRYRGARAFSAALAAVPSRVRIERALSGSWRPQVAVHAEPAPTGGPGPARGLRRNGPVPAAPATRRVAAALRRRPGVTITRRDRRDGHVPSPMSLNLVRHHRRIARAVVLASVLWSEQRCRPYAIQPSTPFWRWRG